MKTIFFVIFLFCPLIANAEFRFRIVEDLGTLDWGYGEVNPVLVQQLMEGLTLSGKAGEPKPALARSWKREGKHTYVFSLRQDAKWSDGKPVCAQAFVDAWLRVLSPQLASPYAHYLYDLKGARAFHSGAEKNPKAVGVSASGCQTLRVELEREASYFPALASHWVLLPIRLDLIGKYGKAWTRPANLAVTGPYALEEWIPDKHYLLKRNAAYYGKSAGEEHLKALVVSDDSTALTLFKKGALDWVRDLPFLEKTSLSSLPEYRLFPSFVEYHLGFRFGARATLSREERCAFSRSLEKGHIPLLLKGGEIPAWSLLPPAFDARAQPPVVSEPRKLQLKQPLEVYFYSKDIHIPLMEWVQEQWRVGLGVEPRLTRLESKTYWSRLQTDPPEVFLSGITASYAHPYSFLSEFLSESHANWGHFASKDYDAAARRVAELDAGPERTKWARRAVAKLVDEECAIIPLYFRQTSALVSTRWSGFEMNPMTYVYLKNVREKK